MKIGVAYYPEQWPQDRWEADARNMAKFGVDVVRMGEFAWSTLEPRRERFEMEWLEDAIGVIAGQGMKVILCTPTAAPPPWLFNRHKSILPERDDGRKWYYGSCRHVCLNNPAYQKYVRRIVTELAKKFGGDKAIYAWQVDNEVSAGETGTCYCDECEQAFRMWLKRRYGTIDRLNKLWGTAFWSQSYVDWHEVPVPRATADKPHPSLMLDYQRFTSAQARAFVKKQKDIIREFTGDDIPVTVNEPCPLRYLNHINAFALSEVPDIFSLENRSVDGSSIAETIIGLDFLRSLKKRPFWITGQQTGASPSLRQPRPGQLRLRAFQAAARGADLVCFYRWRTARSGQGMYCRGILDADDMPRRRYEELRKTAEELKSNAHEWEGYSPVANAAIIIDYDSAWALKTEREAADYFAHAASIHEIFLRRRITVDFVSPLSCLDAYGLVVAPMPCIAGSRTADNLKIFAASGGTLLVTAPAGKVSNENVSGDICPPGALSALLGIERLEFDKPEHGEVNVEFDNGKIFSAALQCSIIDKHVCKTLARYTGGYYADTPALTVNSIESGNVMFLAAGLDAGGLEEVIARAVDTAGLDNGLWEAAAGVEILELSAGETGEKKCFILNHSPANESVKLPQGYSGRELISGADVNGTLTLKGYDVALLALQKQCSEDNL